MILKQWIIIISILCYANVLSAQPDTLLLIHPTVANIETFNFLIENDILPIEGYHILGVYYEKEDYNYQLSEDFINANQLRNFTLYKLDEYLDEDEVFLHNQLSEEFQSLFRCSKGVFFMGGPDMPATLYSDSVHLLTHVTDPYRHYFEVSFLYQLVGRNNFQDPPPLLESNPSYLINCICLGMQSLNVATGGNLVQDIPEMIYGDQYINNINEGSADQIHRNYTVRINFPEEDFTSYHFHPIALHQNSFLADLAGVDDNITPYVLSSHHQSIKTIGNGLIVSALSLDGKIIEAVEHSVYKNVFGVQFHPEKTGLFDPQDLCFVTPDSTINFNNYAMKTGSLSFHVGYWKMIGDILSGSSVTRSR